MNNYHHAFSSLNHCAVTISYTFDILFIKDRRSDIFRKGRIDKGLKYLAQTPFYKLEFYGFPKRTKSFRGEIFFRRVRPICKLRVYKSFEPNHFF